MLGLDVYLRRHPEPIAVLGGAPPRTGSAAMEPAEAGSIDQPCRVEGVRLVSTHVDGRLTTDPRSGSPRIVVTPSPPVHTWTFSRFLS